MCPGFEVLDLRPHPCVDFPRTNQCEAQWPCELREYWLELHTFVDITRAFLSYGSIIIIILGVILNGLSFYILISSGLAKNGSGIYLLALAICDSGNLIANIGIGVWRGSSYEFNQYFMENEWLCRFHGVFVEIFQTISAWIVVSFTVERCLAVWYPMMLRQNRKHRSKIVVVSLTLSLSIFCMSKLFLTGFERDSVFGYMPCNSNRFKWEGMAYLRVAFQTWIPTIIVFVFNCLMFWKLRRIKSNRKTLTSGVRSATCIRKQRSFINKKSPTNPMLIAVSLAYLILVFPLGAVQTVEVYWKIHKAVPVATDGQQKLEYINWMMTKLLIKYIRAFCFGFYQFNFAINFFLYFAAGLEFRLYLQKTIRRLISVVKVYCCCGKPNPKPSEAGSISNATSLSVLPSLSRLASTRTI